MYLSSIMQKIDYIVVTLLCSFIAVNIVEVFLDNIFTVQKLPCRVYSQYNNQSIIYSAKYVAEMAI